MVGKGQDSRDEISGTSLKRPFVQLCLLEPYCFKYPKCFNYQQRALERLWKRKRFLFLVLTSSPHQAPAAPAAYAMHL